MTDLTIRPAQVTDIPIILQLIRDLATYERAPNEVGATEEQLRKVLFGDKPAAGRLVSPFSFTIFPPGLVVLAFTWKIFSSSRTSAAKVTAASYSCTWARLRETGAAAEWSGRCLIGMSRRFDFIVRLAPSQWMNGRCIA